MKAVLLSGRLVVLITAQVLLLLYVVVALCMRCAAALAAGSVYVFHSDYKLEVQKLYNLKLFPQADEIPSP